MKRYSLIIASIIISALSSIRAEGWPANYEGVMLQAFYWDSYQNDTKWTKLEAQADELSAFFDLLWVPNGGKSSGGLGYMPIYWFTNHNSDMGSESQLRSMIAAFKERGTGILTDLVINHRAGESNWYDFPTETWKGKKYHIGLDGICGNDEMAWAAGQPKPTGAYDEGENFDGARDLDHTNANVQDNCKAYCKCLLEDFGYAGWRIDMAKGYAGYYTKMYNQASKPKFSVAEYWDGSYDVLGGYIESTGKESATFDFAFKYAVNEAFGSGDMSKLVWLENGYNPQPAGLIHHWYQQYAVTFVDNHDTYRDDWNKMNGNVVAANAFMLCSPGTPCVFLPHWKLYKDELKQLIAIRKAVGVSNTSTVNVLQYDSSCYMAEVTGSKGKLVIKVGNAWVSPSGYSNSDIKAAGNDYCVWTKVNVTVPETSVAAPSRLYLMGDLPAGHWSTKTGVSMTRIGNTYRATNVELEANKGENNAFFSFVTALGSTGASTEWDKIVNANDRYGAASHDEAIPLGKATKMKLFPGGSTAASANAWSVAPGFYDVVVDFDDFTVKLTAASGVSDEPTIPDDGTITVYWDNSSSKWSTPYIYYWGKSSSPSWPGTALSPVAGDKSIWYAKIPADATGLLFNYGPGAGMDKEGSQTGDFTPIHSHIYNADGDAGLYTSPITLLPLYDANTSVKPEYYNLQGVRVLNPTNGIYIIKSGDKITKQYIK